MTSHSWVFFPFPPLLCSVSSCLSFLVLFEFPSSHIDFPCFPSFISTIFCDARSRVWAWDTDWERSARVPLLLLLILFIYSLSVKAPAACARPGKWNISLMRRRRGGMRAHEVRGGGGWGGGRKPASQPAARMLETAGARAPNEEKKNESALLMSSSPSLLPLHFGGQKKLLIWRHVFIRVPSSFLTNTPKRKEENFKILSWYCSFWRIFCNFYINIRHSSWNTTEIWKNE